MNSIQYLDAVQAKLGLASDYALSKALGISKQAISNYRSGRTAFDDRIALIVADKLGVEQGKVLIDIHIERSKSPEVRAALTRFVENFSTSFKTLLSGRSPRHAWLVTR